AIPGPGYDAPVKKPLTPYSPPPPPSGNEVEEPPLPPSTAPSAAPPPAPPAAPPENDRSDSAVPDRVVVPSCVFVAQKLEDFALYDLDGQVWELRKNRKGKLVLLDFWATTCGPCRAELPFMVSLDRKYRRYGLQVIGIANQKETTFPQKQNAVRQARA